MGDNYRLHERSTGEPGGPLKAARQQLADGALTDQVELTGRQRGAFDRLLRAVQRTNLLLALIYRGMIDAGQCAEIQPDDVQDLLTLRPAENHDER